MNQSFSSLFIGITIFFSLHVSAQHQDIWLSSKDISNGLTPALDCQQGIEESTYDSSCQVIVNPARNGLVDITTGYLFYSADFGDVAFGPSGTGQPGFSNIKDFDGDDIEIFQFMNTNGQTFTSLQDKSILSFRVVDRLAFWNGNSWDTSVTNRERIRIFDAQEENVYVTTDSIYGDDANDDKPEFGLIGVANGGFIHDHIDYYIESEDSSDPSIGAYMFNMELYVTKGIDGKIIYKPSDPVRIVLNYKLDDEEFEAAISALIDPVTESVPYPNYFIIFLFSLLIIISNSHINRYRIF